MRRNLRPNPISNRVFRQQLRGPGQRDRLQTMQSRPE